MSSPSAFLETLLSLSSVLRSQNVEGKGKSTAGEALSLKQLIGVHESLLSAVLMRLDLTTDLLSTSNEKRVDEKSVTILEIATRILGDDQEAEMCASILQSKNTSSDNDAANVLLAIQYLLRRQYLAIQSEASATNPSAPSLVLEGLKKITFPLLLSSPNWDNRLRDAILDASFASASMFTTSLSKENGDSKVETKEIAAASAKELVSCLSLIYDSTIEILNTPMNTKADMSLSRVNTMVTTSSRILSRLLGEYQANGDAGIQRQNSNKQIILSFMHRLTMKILGAVCFYSSSSISSSNKSNENGGSGMAVPLRVNGKTSLFLRPITALLLPAILEDWELAMRDANGKKSNAHVHVDIDGSLALHDQRLEELWNFICYLIDPRASASPPVGDDMNDSPSSVSLFASRRKCRSWNKAAPSVASALLAIMADKIHSLPLILPSHLLKIHNRQEQDMTGVEGVKRKPLLQHPTFWKFLESSLNRGFGTDSDASRGSGSSNADNGTSDIGGMKGGWGFNSKMSSSKISKTEVGGVSNPYRDEDAEDADVDVDQLVRRRAIHILSSVLDSEYSDSKFRKGGGSRASDGKSGGSEDTLRVKVHKERIGLWKKYTLCFEALEMETEVHLVDQVWGTVTDLCAACVKIEAEDKNLDNGADMDGVLLPSMNWKWVGALFGRVFMSDSPTLRKLGLFRLLQGKAGINWEGYEGKGLTKADALNKQQQKQKGKKGKVPAEPAPISIISPGFILGSLIPSFNSLSTSVGTGVNFEVNGKTTNNDLAKMLPPFLKRYTAALFHDSKRLQAFVEGLISEKFISNIKARTLVLVFDAILSAWNQSVGTKVTLCMDSVDEGVTALQVLCKSGSVVLDYKKSLLLDFSRLLSYSILDGARKPDPALVLKTLAMYTTASGEITEPTEFDIQSSVALNTWLKSFGGEEWSAIVGASCASSFVSGDLITIPVVKCNNGLIETSSFERQRGAAIVKLCSLSNSPSALLWPAINKGLGSSVPCLGQKLLPLPVELGHKAARAIVLLENGCKECILGGIGHGDLVLDKEGNMMPPPPSIEVLISRAVNFTLGQLQLVSICNFDKNVVAGDPTYGGRSTKSGEFANHFSLLIHQLLVLKKSYPSSVSMFESLNMLLRSSLNTLLSTEESLNRTNASCSAEKSVEMVKHISIIYGVLTTGAKLKGEGLTAEEEKDQLRNVTSICSAILRMHFRKPALGSTSTVSTWQMKAMRSIFELAKWGCLLYLVPMAYDNAASLESVLRDLHDEIITVALDSVNACPANALLLLFETAVSTSKRSFEMFTPADKFTSNVCAKNIANIIETLFTIMNDTDKNSTRSYMLNVTCSLIFRPALVADEFSSLQRIKDEGKKPNMRVDAPIFQAFRKLIQEAGSTKPYVSNYVLSYISVGWLGTQEDKATMGLPAIPYRLDIAKLLIHKEEKIEKDSAHQEGLVKQYKGEDAAELPDGAPSSSMARGFLLVFISKLPNAKEMDKVVLTKLCHFLIMWLLENVCLVHDRSGSSLLTTGSTEYVQKIRAWQSLCMLNRFVTSDVAKKVLRKVFESMKGILHGPIRYWIEVFTIQIARTNPMEFIDQFRNEIRKCDISQQHASSLMIIGGNLIVGTYSDLFLQTITENNAVILRDIIAGVIPWLSSTQGFSRAIAQLLVHKLIPLAKDTIIQDHDAFFLETISQFLQTNPEMKRLRKKQRAFFETYDVDDACTVEGMFSVDIDDGEESNPPHLVEVLKKCLVEVYNEQHSSSSSSDCWKQLEGEMRFLALDGDSDGDEQHFDNEEVSLVNFQRKIVPIDTLNLTLEDQKQMLLRNAAGRKRQSLIVCASLIDKVTNLAGLTRTAEIFAADKIVVPDSKVQKMDNFKSIAVGAEDWINIEECKEVDLLVWLKERKNEGYSIIGIEQTSSSRCLANVKFEEKSVLLLGKEKEGIPVEFLQVVDRCVEIPQLGVIRSLNVHVSGAITIWEYTKQMMR